MTRRHLLGAGMLGGIGFTMSVFIAGLAFTGQADLTLAKIGVLAGSLVSGISGWIGLRGVTAQQR